MLNKRFLIIFITLLFSLSIIVSSVSAEEIADDVVLGESDNSLSEVSVDESDTSLDVVDETDSYSLEDPVEEVDSLTNDVISSSDVDESNSKESKNKLESSTLSSDPDNYASIKNIVVNEKENIYIPVFTNYTDIYNGFSYYLDIDDINCDNVFSYTNQITLGESTEKVFVGVLPVGTYNVYYYDDNGYCFDTILTVKKAVTQAKITVSSYSSYYNSGKTYTIKVINKSNNKPISKLKLKLVYKSNGKTKTYYVTTDSKGIAKPKVSLGVGTYKLTVSSTVNNVKSNNPTSTVKVNKMPIKITLPNYTSYYKSGKKLTVKAINKNNKKGVAVKLKFVYKKAKAKAKVYYVTTNAKGIAKIKIPVGIGEYKLTVNSANSNFKSNKASSKVKVNKYVTFKAGKYTGKLTYKQVLALKKAKANGKDKDYYVFTGKYYKFKEPIYKTVKVKKSRWDYKYKLASEDWWGEWGSDWETYNPKTPKGYKWCGTVYKSGNGWSKTYYKYKKKVYYWDTKEVKTGKYKKAKDKIYMTISTNSGKGLNPKGDLIEVWSSEYWCYHADNIITKSIKL